jgi:Trk K+ transport system NAD-binding subunit
MNLKNLYPYIYGILVVLVFVFGFIGFYDYLGHEAHFWPVLFSVLSFFAFDDGDEGRIWAGNPANPVLVTYILVAKYLALALIGLGISEIFFKYIKVTFQTLKISLFYRKHIVIFSLDSIGYHLAKGLLKDGYQVVVVEKNEESPFVEEIENLGGIVFPFNPFESNTLKKTKLLKARTIILANDSDEINIEIAGSIRKYACKHKQLRNNTHELLKLYVHITDQNNASILKDYFNIDSEQHIDLHTINYEQLAAQKIYDQFSPHQYFQPETAEVENSIALIGLDLTAENFLLENIILSHYETQHNLKIYLVDPHADDFYHHFLYKYPFANDFITLIPVKQLNASFFGHFAMSKAHIEQLSKVKVAYFFGKKDAEILNTAASFRQFLYTQNLSITKTPLIISLPESSAIYDFIVHSSANKETIPNLFNHALNKQVVKRTSDTITSASIIEESELNDKLSRVINFFYAVNYEFAFKIKQQFGIDVSSEVIAEMVKFILQFPINSNLPTEENLEKDFFELLATKIPVSADDLFNRLSIKRNWNALSKRKKESNRYAARHIKVKLHVFTSIGMTQINSESIIKHYPVLAKLEHSRWSAEKMVLNFKYGPFPAVAEERNLLKEIVKIHNQLIPYENLTQEEKDKDLNLFLLIPLLKGLQNTSTN